jgi:hypothetical protein
MRLIETSTLQLHEFFGSDIPPYAILSHRWDESEVSFQEFSGGKGHGRPGWSKITGCCYKALNEGWDYVVSDTAFPTI